MKLYEINENIQRLADQLEVDPETGEVLCSDEICAAVDALQLEKQSVLEYLAKLILNIRAEAAALKDEEQRLKDRRTKMAAKEKRLIQILDRECAGEKADLGVATFSYRKTARLEISDADTAIRWLHSNQHADCYRVLAPEIAKSEVKKLIRAGVNVPGCTIVQEYSCSLK